MSTTSRLAAIEQALASRQPPEVITIRLITVHSRRAFEASGRWEASQPPRPPRPQPRGRVRLVAEFADNFFAENNIVVEPERETTLETEQTT